MISKGTQNPDKMGCNNAHLQRVDPDIQDVIACYKEVFVEKRKQTVQSRIDFFHKNQKMKLTIRCGQATYLQ